MAAREMRTCQDCKREFTIEPEDFQFYDRISVPAPRFCPHCRMVFRMAWRNERSLYKRRCQVPGHSEELIAAYAPETPVTIYDQQYWWSDEWNPRDFGKEYDFSKPFFEQLQELLRRVPLIAVFNVRAVNSEYCNHADSNKDSYYLMGCGWNERVMFANRSHHNKDSADLYTVEKLELCYECSYCTNSYKLLFSQYCDGCSDSAFLYNCRNCTNCFGCVNLRSKSYCFFNEQLSKGEYEKKVAELRNGNYAVFLENKRRFEKQVLKAIHKYADILNSTRSTGDHIRNAKSCRVCFDIAGDQTENCKYVNVSGFNTKDLFDNGPGAGWGSELLYQTVDINASSRLISCLVVYDSNNVQYSINCHGSHDLIGCYGLRSAEYCILNKQYSKEEYTELAPQVLKHMFEMPYKGIEGREYVYGDFFPIEISPFAYNETVAQEYIPITETVASEKKYPWRASGEKSYKITKKPEDLPLDTKEVADSILADVVGCEHSGECHEQCTTAFRITRQELELYRHLDAALPRLCPNCRHYQRLAQRTPMKLWHRSCQCAGAKSENGVYINTAKHQHGSGSCLSEFETAYAPDRPEIVYCEQCYNAEVV